MRLAEYVKSHCPNLLFSGLMTIGMRDYTSTPENFKVMDIMPSQTVLCKKEIYSPIAFERTPLAVVRAYNATLYILMALLHEVIDHHRIIKIYIPLFLVYILSLFLMLFALGPYHSEIYLPISSLYSAC